MTTTTFEPQSRVWTREEYYRLAEEGWFSGQRVQLIDGEIIQTAPQGHEHTFTISKAVRILQALFEPENWVRMQLPLNIGRNSDPEPDLAVVEGSIDDYTDHPTTAMLVVEVSDTSLRLDRRKAALYASAGVGEYWIINLAGRCLETYRRPVVSQDAKNTMQYADHEVLGLDAEVTPQAAKGSRPIQIASFFPANR